MLRTAFFGVEGTAAGAENYKRWRFATSADSSRSVSISAMMKSGIGFDYAAMAMELANAPQDKRIDEMSAHKLKFVLVNDMAPRKPSVCTECSRPLDRGYLHDLSTSKCYCGIECHPQWMMVSEFIGTIGPTDPFELAFAWPKLTVDA